MNNTEEKINKITTAIFMVTDYISKDEPVRHRLRILSLEFLSNSFSTNLARALEIKKELIALLNLGKTIGLISEMNADILLGELGNLQFPTPDLQPLISTPQLPVPVLSDTMSDTVSYRKEAILGFLKEKKEAAISDIKMSVKANERAIQRDLTSLAEKGLIEKVGENKWTKYKIVV